MIPLISKIITIFTTKSPMRNWCMLH